MWHPKMGAELGFRTSTGFPGRVKSGIGTEKGGRGIRWRRTKGRSI